MPSYYKILNVVENCSQEDVVAAYKNLAKKYHPDKGGTTEEFRLISEAYEVLTDKDKREQYDCSFLEEMYINFADPEKVFEMVMNRSDKEVFREYVNNHNLHDDWAIYDDVEESYILKSIKKD